MSSPWREVRFGDILELQRGHDLPTGSRGAGDVPVIGSFGVTGTHDQAAYDGPGVAIGRSGAAIGTATFVEGSFWPLNTCLFVRDFKGNDPRWVYRLLQTIDFMAFNSGSAQPSLNRNFLVDITVSLPDIHEQRAIADVLAALDDKIAANDRVVWLSGDLSASLFAAAVREIDYGDATFNDVADVGGGGTPKTAVDDYWNGNVFWATPTDVTGLNGPYLDATARMITEDGLSACSSSLYPRGSILMTSRATIGAFAIAQVPMAVNQGFIVVNAKSPDLQWWLFHEMRSRVDEFVSYANGATFLELSRGRFKKLPVRMPAESRLAAFTAVAEPLHRSAAQAQSENHALARTRDELLPLLMAGKIRVKDAEATLSEVL